MVLSIGMIVKNEEKYLEECLTALKPILDELDSELIIADTGSTDRTVEIAEKFTDNVFYFEWIKDFAAARNSTLNRAQGEWYMFVDADEICQDPTELIRFFKSGEYRKYNNAGYVIRNYTNVEKTTYKDFIAARLAKRTEYLMFKNAIHEQLTPMLAPMKHLNSVFFDHYGYVYTSDDEGKEKLERKQARNIEILLKELKEDEAAGEHPDTHFLLYDQIADYYQTNGDEKKALEYIDMGLEKRSHLNPAILGYYNHKISIIGVLGEYDKTIELVDEYFDTTINPWHTKDFASDCCAYTRRGYAYYKLKQYAKAVSDYAKFADIYGRYKKGKMDDVDLMFSLWQTNEAWVMVSYDVFFRCCYAAHRYEVAESYARAVPIEEYNNLVDVIENHLRIRMEIMDEVGYKNFDFLFGQLDDHGKAFLLALSREKMAKTSPGNRSTVIRKLAALRKTNALADIYHGYFDTGAANYNKIADYLAENGSENGDDLLRILLEQQNDITPFLYTKDFFADRTVQLAIKNFPDTPQLFEDYNINNISREGLEKAANLYGWVMLRVMERRNPIAKTFELYGKLGVRWYDEFKSGDMPGDIRAALLVNNVCEAHAQVDITKFKSAVNDLRNEVPDLTPVVTAYFNEVKEDFRRQNDPTAQISALAKQVKQNIRAMIKAGKLVEAQNTLDDLAGLCPKDTDIESLREAIDNLKGGY